MTPERWGEVETACRSVLASPPAEREAAVERACGSDTQLRAEVEALLQEQERADRLLEVPAWEAAAMAFVEEPEAERPPRLHPAQTIGPFVIEELAGIGGMGEVYRATDTRLGRTVAIKVLPPDMAGDADSRRRLELEARTVSGLSHPHICALFDIGTAAPPEGGSEPPVDYLVMEYLQGRTLAERMAPSPSGDGSARRALPLDEALTCGIQIADALAAAHRRGIVHCDLKPGNVMLTREGVKLLDFGIARIKRAALVEEPGARGGGRTPAARSGALHGTINYMAPEQFAGKEPDARSDMFAFGALLFEMITGHRAFEGSSPAGVVTAILGDTPATVSSYQPLAPRALDELVRRCLAKHPDERWDSARLAADELQRVAVETAPAPVQNAGRATAAPRPGDDRRWWRDWRLGLAAVAATGLVAIGLASMTRPSAGLAPLQRFDLNLGDFEVHPRTEHAILSPDGSRIVFTTKDTNGRRTLRARRLDQNDAITLFDGGAWPFLSPDGRWVAFFASGRLYKVSVDGGTPVPVCDAQFGATRGAAWGDDGTIAVAPDVTGGLVRVPSSGGIPAPLTTPDAAKKEVAHRWPQMLPGSRAVLFTAHTVAASWDDASIEVQRLDTGERKTLRRGGYAGRYLPSGHLVFVRHNTLYAAPMDLGRLELAGPAVPVLNEVVGDAEVGWLEFSASGTGAALCFTGVWQPLQHSPVWYDRSGRAQHVAIPPAPYADPRVSPRREQIVFSLGDGFTSRLLGLYEPGLKEPRRIQSDRVDLSPLWAPDGVHVVFGRENEIGIPDLCWRRADGTGPVQRLTTSRYMQWPSSFSPDGRTMVYTEIRPDTLTDIWTVSLDLRDPDRPVPGTPQPWLQTAFAEEGAVFSPDGRWIAYESWEAGRSEIYVRRTDGGSETRRQISRGGGARALWVPGRNEIVYERAADHSLVVVPINVARGEVIPGTPASWPGVRLKPFDSSYGIRGFDLSPDGNRVLVLAPPEPAPPRSRTSATLFLNFFDELRRRTRAQ